VSKECGHAMFENILGFCVSQESVDMQSLKRFMTFVCERECVRESV